MAFLSSCCIQIHFCRSVFEAWKIYVYRCTLKKLGIAYADQRRATQLQGNKKLYFTSIYICNFIKLLYPTGSACMVYAILMELGLHTLCAWMKSHIATFLFAVSFNCWLCQAVSVKGEGLLSSRLSTAHHRALLLKAFIGWLTVTRLSQAHSKVKEMHQKRILDA